MRYKNISIEDTISWMVATVAWEVLAMLPLCCHDIFGHAHHYR